MPAPWHMLGNASRSAGRSVDGFQQWCKCGALWEILTQLANTLREECEIGVREDIIDATFPSAKGNSDAAMGKTRHRKG